MEPEEEAGLRPPVWETGGEAATEERSAELVGRDQCLRERQAGPQEFGGQVTGPSRWILRTRGSSLTEGAACKCPKRAPAGATSESQVSQGGCGPDP